MVRSLSSKQNLGALSILVGIVALVAYFATLSSWGTAHEAAIVLALAGFALGAMRVKTKAGLAGIILSLIPLLHLGLIALIGLAYSPK